MIRWFLQLKVIYKLTLCALVANIIVAALFFANFWTHLQEEQALNAYVQGHGLVMHDVLGSAEYAARINLLVSILLVVALVLYCVVAVLVIRRVIVRPLQEVQAAAESVSTHCIVNLNKGLTALSLGDLTVRAAIVTQPPKYQSQDEIGQTTLAVRELILNVHQAMYAYEQARGELEALYAEIEEKNSILSLANVQLQSQATTDPLTGLPNHRSIMGQVNTELAKEQTFALLFVDVDHFKRVNDTLGHRAGDGVLREVASRLSSHLREADKVGRYGGEEFAVVLSNVDAQRAYEIAERLRLSICEEPCYWEKEDTCEVVPLTITASVGVAVYPADAQARDTLLEAADKAMYQAKHSGRNRVCRADETLELQSLALSGVDRERAEAAAMHALSAVAQLHDMETSEHARRMVQIAAATARCLGRSEEEVYLIRAAALLHDIGKIGIPSEIVQRPGPLSEDEWAIMRQHPRISQRILKQVGGRFELVSHIVLAHHERWDGKGYPYGLEREAIPLGARILAVADSYDAMISDRPYRKALSKEVAREELVRCRGSQFDPEVVDAFLQVLEDEWALVPDLTLEQEIMALEEGVFSR